MANASFELGVIGGFLLESYHPTPLKGVVGEWGLVPEHFSDSTNRAAFAAVMAADSADPPVLATRAGRDVDCRFVMTPDRSDEYRLSVDVLARNYSPRKPLDLRAEPGRFTSL